MKKQLSIHDWQALSALLDGKLSPQEKSRLEARLSKDANLREALEGLRRTRILLRNSPKIRAPHNFSLTRQMVGIQEKQRTGAVYPLLKFSTVLASILFIFALLGDFFVRQPLPMSTLGVREMVMATEAPPAPAAQQDFAGYPPTMTPVGELMTEETLAKSSELSNAPMEPLPTTMPSTLKMEPSPTLQEVPLLAIAPEVSSSMAQEAITQSIQANEMEAGAGIAMTETVTTADQTTQTKSFPTESLAQTPMVGFAERTEEGILQRGINIWRVLEIIFGSLIVILGLSAIIFHSRKSHDRS